MSQIDDQKDMDEFAARVAGGDTSRDFRGIAKVSDDGPQPIERRTSTGKPVQWALNGDGFTPATESRPRLEPGVYGISMHENLITFTVKSIVTDRLLRLPDSKSDAVISEIEEFWARKALFNRYGFAHKRGFLLWGDQGSGKTTTVKFVMSGIVARGGLAVVVDSGISPNLVARGLQLFRDVEPDRPVVVVMEDIDALVGRFGEQEILSILDGESSIARVVYVATTNYPENLAKRMTNRPARFDRVVKVGMPSAEARRMYLESRETDLTGLQLDRWVGETDGMSIAHLHELVAAVLCLGCDFDVTVARLRSMSRAPKSDDGEAKLGFGSDA